MSSFRLGAATALAISAACVLSAQTAAPAINALSVEGTLPFGQIGFVGTPNIPANILQSIVGGALEIRQLVDRRNDGLYRVRHILVQAGAPNPTAAGGEVAVLEDYVFRVNSVVPGADPSSLTLIGQIDRENMPSPFGSATGLPVIYSFGYETGTPTQFGNVSMVLPGRMATYIRDTDGTLTLGGGTTPPPGDGGVVIGIAESITTVQPEIVLNAMATDPEGRTLTYSWRVVSGPGSIISPNTAETRVQLPRIATQTVFEVTVTPAGGTPVSKRVGVSYIGQPF